MSASIGQIFMGKTVIDNKGRAVGWIMGVTFLFYLPIFLFNEASSGLAYRNAVGIWAESLVQFAIFVTVFVAGHRRYGRLKSEQLKL
jgi:hypothetical protein